MINDVTAYISTKDRYDCLFRAMLSVAMQAELPKRFIVFDDGAHEDLRDRPEFVHIFKILEAKGVSWEVVFGEGKGQVHNHQRALDMATTRYIWRLDDDDYAEPNVLVGLLESIRKRDDIAAVGPSVLEPSWGLPLYDPDKYSSLMGDIFTKQNAQWCTFPGELSVDHLHNTFLYRKDLASHYDMDLSPAGHREETLFSYRMRCANNRLIVNGGVTVWHMRASSGGIRSYAREDFESDEAKFRERVKLMGNNDLAGKKLIVLDNGLGDHWAFKQILPEIIERYGIDNIVLSVCYPAVFSDSGVKLISISEAKVRFDIDQYNLYKWMWDHDWKSTLIEAYRAIYLS